MDLHVGIHHEFDIESYGGEITILNYFGWEEEIKVPASICGYPVTTIGKFAFCNTHKEGNTLKVKIPTSVTRIEDNAFSKEIAVIRYFDSSMEGFEYDGMWITNPFVDETGRFKVNPQDYYGVQVEDY